MKTYLALFVATLLASCSMLPTGQQQAQREALFQAHLISLGYFTHWQASGRLAISTIDDGGSARLVWKQRGDNFVLRLSTGFGHGTLQLSRSAYGARLITPSGETLTGQRAEALLYRYLGWHIPLEQLRQWLTGRPGTAQDYVIGRQGLLENIAFNGWRVAFEQYRSDIYPALPSRITLYKGAIKVCVIVDNWNHNKQTITSKRIAIPEAAPVSK